MLASRHATARLQSDFYRDQFRKMLRWIFYSIIVMFLLILGIIYFILLEPPQSYYANTQSGRIFNMPAHSET